MIGTDDMTKRVLAIDDDETILAVMNNVLTMHDYEAVTATQWVEALDVLNERTPDLLLLDLQMPHVDGFFLLEWIREQDIEMPVIVVSAYLDDESIGRLESLGVDAFIWKPFNVTDLITKVDELLGTEGRNTLEPTVEPAPLPAAIEELEAAGPDDEAEAETEEGEPRRRRRVRRRRKGSKKHQRRRTALYLGIIAILSLGISGLNAYMRNIAASVEQSVNEAVVSPAGKADLLQELVRAQVNSQLERERRALQPQPKKLELDLQKK